MPKNQNTHAVPSGTLDGCLMVTLFSLNETFLFRLAKVQANRADLRFVIIETEKLSAKNRQTASKNFILFHCPLDG